MAGDQDWHLRDVDGDARPDLLVVASFDGWQAQLPESGAWILYPNTGAGFGAPLAVQAPATHPLEIAGQGSMASVELVDVDGDGRLEWVNTGRALDPGFSLEPELWALPHDRAFAGLYGMSITSCAWGACTETFPTGRWLTKDLDGDGKVELVEWSHHEGTTLPAGNPTWTVWSLD